MERNHRKYYIRLPSWKKQDEKTDILGCTSAVRNQTKITKQLIQYKEATDVVNQRSGQDASLFSVLIKGLSILFKTHDQTSCFRPVVVALEKWWLPP